MQSPARSLHPIISIVSPFEADRREPTSVRVCPTDEKRCSKYAELADVHYRRHTVIGPNHHRFIELNPTQTTTDAKNSTQSNRTHPTYGPNPTSVQSLLKLVVLLVRMVKTGVRAHVALAGEASSAEVTAVRSVAGVNQPVLLQVCQLRERLGAHFTPEWPLTCMSSQVYLEVR